MSQPVKLSDSLVLDARLTAEPSKRSIAGQVEFWARLGRSVDLLLEGRQVLKLMRADSVRTVSDCLESVDTPEGRDRVFSYLRSRPYPHYEADPGSAELIVRIDEDGTRVTGRFVGSDFVSAATPFDETASPSRSV